MIEISIKKNLTSNTYILTSLYEGDELMIYLKEKGGILSVELPERTTQHLMNMCIAALKDFKSQKLRKEEDLQGKVRFYGVDYS